MAIEILIMAQDRGGLSKGDIVAVKESPAKWGLKEGLPMFVRVTVPDASVSEVLGYLASWSEILDYEVVASNANGWRIRLFFDRSKASASGLGSLTSERVESYLSSNYGIAVVSAKANEVVIDVPRSVDLAELKEDLKLRVEQMVRPRRHCFSAADVDLVIAAGGMVTQTKSQIVARMIDRVVE